MLELFDYLLSLVFQFDANCSTWREGENITDNNLYLLNKPEAAARSNRRCILYCEFDCDRSIIAANHPKNRERNERSDY